MAKEDALHRCVTKFMFDTCRYSTNSYDIDEFFLSSNIWEAYSDFFEIVPTGSSAEFYIKPMLSCVGDLDIMQCLNNALTIPAQHTPPTELPDNFYRTVTLYEIIDSDQPGFVYLKSSYVFTKNDKGRYVVEKIEDFNSHILQNAKGFNLANCIRDEAMHSYLCHWLKQAIPQDHNLRRYSYAAEQHGPAIMETIRHGTGRLVLESDLVLCMRCLVWLPHAADWPKRPRNHDWPNQTTINVVVKNGCDVVGAVHPRCRQDEWMNTHQWRLSFSRAEVTLLNSWTPVQQIIYHMLRFVIKHGVLSKTNDSDTSFPTLCNYHIKTLMMWECEEKPQSWWSAESSLIKVCSSLLHKLCDWVADKHCRHYFISNCNLIDHFVDASLMICSHLRCFADSSFLVNWFVENYIGKCAQSCPDIDPALFEDISTTGNVERAVQAVVDCNLNTLPREIYKEFLLPEKLVMMDLMIHRIDHKRTPMIMKQFQNFNPNVREYYTAAASLQVAYTVSMHSLTENLLEMLWMLFDLGTVAVEDATSRLDYGARLSIGKAIKLATLSNSRSNALEMLHNEMAKAYLHCSFAYGQESTYCVAHVLLAALFCKSGHYQAAIEHCKQVRKCCDHVQGSQGTGAEYMPQIDETVDFVFDLVVLYQHVHRSASNVHSNLEPDGISPHELIENLLRLSDILLFRAMEMQLNGCPETLVAEYISRNARDYALSYMDKAVFVTTLELVALEKLIRVRQVMVRELQSEQFPTANEFEALYAYRCGLFDKCMDLCLNYVRRMFDGNYLVQGYLVAFPEMLSLLDGELVSVFGIIQLLNPKSFIDFPNDTYVANMLTLLLYVMAQCYKNCCTDSPYGLLNLIRFAHSEVIPAGFVLDRMILKLTYRSLRLYLKSGTDLQTR